MADAYIVEQPVVLVRESDTALTVKPLREPVTVATRPAEDALSAAKDAAPALTADDVQGEVPPDSKLVGDDAQSLAAVYCCMNTVAGAACGRIVCAVGPKPPQCPDCGGCQWRLVTAARPEDPEQFQNLRGEDYLEQILNAAEDLQEYTIRDDDDLFGTDLVVVKQSQALNLALKRVKHFEPIRRGAEVVGKRVVRVDFVLGPWEVV